MSNPRGNVPLSVQEAVRAALTDQEIALLAFFDAPGFNQMTKEEALLKLETRFFNANGTPLGGEINTEGANGESSNA